MLQPPFNVVKKKNTSMIKKLRITHLFLQRFWIVYFLSGSNHCLDQQLHLFTCDSFQK